MQPHVAKGGKHQRLDGGLGLDAVPCKRSTAHCSEASSKLQTQQPQTEANDTELVQEPPAKLITEALAGVYDVQVAVADVEDVLSPCWLRGATYPFQMQGKLPRAGQDCTSANYRFAAYAQPARPVYEALPEDEMHQLR